MRESFKLPATPSYDNYLFKPGTLYFLVHKDPCGYAPIMETAIDLKTGAVFQFNSTTPLSTYSTARNPDIESVTCVYKSEGPILIVPETITEDELKKLMDSIPPRITVTAEFDNIIRNMRSPLNSDNKQLREVFVQLHAEAERERIENYNRYLTETLRPGYR